MGDLGWMEEGPAVSASSVERPHDLLVVVRQGLSDAQQRAMMDAVKVMDTGERRQYRYGFDKLFEHRIDGPCGPVAAKLVSEAQRIVQLVRASQTVSSLSETYDVGMIEGLAYRKDALLQPHIDYVRGAAIIATLGATTHFFVRVGHGQELEVKLKSGDIVVFPTDGPSAVYHGIRHFEATRPALFDFEPYHRISVQFRQYYEHVA